ncbi:MAG TPA: hypothetical protein VK957_20115 [Lunatimonas sp.]|nr:hypothetical protein [Lunatimonas sp.]
MFTLAVKTHPCICGKILNYLDRYATDAQITDWKNYVNVGKKNHPRICGKLNHLDG